MSFSLLLVWNRWPARFSEDINSCISLLTLPATSTVHVSKSSLMRIPRKSLPFESRTPFHRQPNMPRQISDPPELIRHSFKQRNHDCSTRSRHPQGSFQKPYNKRLIRPHLPVYICRLAAHMRKIEPNRIKRTSQFPKLCTARYRWKTKFSPIYRIEDLVRRTGTRDCSDIVCACNWMLFLESR